MSTRKDAARDFALWKAVKPGEQFWETALAPAARLAHRMFRMPPNSSAKTSTSTPAVKTSCSRTTKTRSLNGVCQCKTFARHWMHVRFLLVEGKKMSKSEANFYTLRDLLLKGYRASAIRFLLISVPYRKQMNFTSTALRMQLAAVEKLRAFAGRISSTSADGAIKSDA